MKILQNSGAFLCYSDQFVVNFGSFYKLSSIIFCFCPHFSVPLSGAFYIDFISLEAFLVFKHKSEKAHNFCAVFLCFLLKSSKFRSRGQLCSKGQRNISVSLVWQLNRQTDKQNNNQGTYRVSPDFFNLLLDWKILKNLEFGNKVSILALTLSKSRSELALLIQSHLSLKATFFSWGGASSGSCKSLVSCLVLCWNLTKCHLTVPSATWQYQGVAPDSTKWCLLTVPSAPGQY